MDDITIIIPTSSINDHPRTNHIDEVIESIRHHFKYNEIIITFDGLHPDFAHYKERYDAYKTEMLWRCLHKYDNVLPIVFDEHVHQSGMMRKALEEVKTSLILYVEHDAPLTTDRFIDWHKCIDLIKSGDANTIRFHFEEVIPVPHWPLMIGDPENGFLRTFQWSQRPHLSSTAYYKDEVMRHFPEGKPTFIEDIFHGAVINSYDDDGMFGWYRHRLWIYYPDGGIKRSYTTDGRGRDHKVGEGF